MPATVESTPFLPGLSPVCGKPIVARFDAAHMSSDGGLLALREVEQRLGIAQRLGEAEALLVHAATHSGLPEVEARRTTRSGLTTGGAG